MINVNVFALGPIGANTYVLTDSGTPSACVIDCGEAAEELLGFLKGKSLAYVLLTHGHFDHIWGVKKLKAAHPEAKVCIHSADERCLSDTGANLAGGRFGSFEPIEADLLLKEGDFLPFADTGLRVLHTPGHSEGSVCYLDEKNRLLFTGDTLFCRSCGRVDFPGSSPEKMEESLARLAALDGDCEVFPGHDRSTTLSFERQHNVFMRRL